VNFNRKYTKLVNFAISSITDNIFSVQKLDVNFGLICSLYAHLHSKTQWRKHTERMTSENVNVWTQQHITFGNCFLLSPSKPLRKHRQHHTDYRGK
jgi:uncharacterized membrane protein